MNKTEAEVIGTFDVGIATIRRVAPAAIAGAISTAAGQGVLSVEGRT